MRNMYNVLLNLKNHKACFHFNFRIVYTEIEIKNPEAHI